MNSDGGEGDIDSWWGGGGGAGGGGVIVTGLRL